MAVFSRADLKVLKSWGLHPITDELATLEQVIAKVLAQFSQQEIEGCSNFVFPADNIIIILIEVQLFNK